MKRFFAMSIIFLVFFICSTVHAFDLELEFGQLIESTYSAYPPGTIVNDHIHYYHDSGVHVLYPAEYIVRGEVGHRIWRFRPYLRTEALFDRIYDGFTPESLILDAGFTFHIWHFFFRANRVSWDPLGHEGPGQRYNGIWIGFKVGEK